MSSSPICKILCLRTVNVITRITQRHTHFSLRWLLSPSKLNAWPFAILAAFLSALLLLVSGASALVTPTASSHSWGDAAGERCSSCGALLSFETGSTAAFETASWSAAPTDALLIGVVARSFADAASLTACWQWRHAYCFLLRSSGLPPMSRAAKPLLTGQAPYRCSLASSSEASSKAGRSCRLLWRT